MTGVEAIPGVLFLLVAPACQIPHQRRRFISPPLPEGCDQGMGERNGLLASKRTHSSSQSESVQALPDDVGGSPGRLETLDILLSRLLRPLVLWRGGPPEMVESQSLFALVRHVDSGFYPPQARGRGRGEGVRTNEKVSRLPSSVSPCQPCPAYYHCELEERLWK